MPRLRYQSKRLQTSTPKAKAASTRASAPLEPMYQLVERPSSTPSKASHEKSHPASESDQILLEALQSFQLQNSQLGQAIMQVNYSLRELSQGQSQMIMMMGQDLNPHLDQVVPGEQAGSDTSMHEWAVPETVEEDEVPDHVFQSLGNPSEHM